MRLTDPRQMRALAHPLRIELFERLAIEGTATASELAPLVGSTASNCSFHLRTLADAGYIERVPGSTGRERPWRVIDIRQDWDSHTDDADLAQASSALTTSLREWEFDRIRQASARKNPSEWQGKLWSSSFTLRLTPGEADDLGRQIAALAEKYVDRWEKPDEVPAGARPVRIFSTMYLVRSAAEMDAEGAGDESPA